MSQWKGKYCVFEAIDKLRMCFLLFDVAQHTATVCRSRNEVKVDEFGS